MPTTSFAGRRPTYLEQYARTVASYQRYQDITRDIQAEQDRLNYLDSLIQSERQNLTNLQEVFRVRPQDLGSAQALLQQQYAGEDAARRRVAAGRVARAEGLQLPLEQRQELTRLTTGQSRQPETARRRVARGRAPSGAPRAISPEEQAAERALQQQLEAAFFAGPAGIRGGYDGQAIVERREQTAAPEGVSFSTEQDAFEAALGALQDGVLAVEDFNFEPEVLQSRQRVAQLQQARAEAPGAQYTDPSRERFRRELIARGYDPDLNQGRFLQYQKSPYYKAMVRADDILNDIIAADVELEAVGKPQQLARDLIRQLDATGRPYDLKKVERQLGKVLEGEELQEGLAFALATKEYDSQGLQSPSQRELQKAAKEREAKAQEQAAQADAEITADLEQELDQQALFVKRLQKPETREEAVAQRFRPIDLDEPEPAAPAPAPVQVATAVTDPSDPRFRYRRLDDGYEVTRTDMPDMQPRIARPGTRAFRSIEQVLAGGQPLPPAPPPTPEPAQQVTTLPETTITAAPAGETEPAPEPAPKRLKWNPATQSFE
jgi:hypothetical protein